MPFTDFSSFTGFFSFRDFFSFTDFSFTVRVMSSFLLEKPIVVMPWCYKKYTERLIDRFPVLQEEFCSLIPFTGGGTRDIKFIPKTCILSQLVPVSTSPPVGKDHMLLWVEKSNVFINQEEPDSGGINFKRRKDFSLQRLLFIVWEKKVDSLFNNHTSKSTWMRIDCLIVFFLPQAPHGLEEVRRDESIDTHPASR